MPPHAAPEIRELPARRLADRLPRIAPEGAAAGPGGRRLAVGRDERRPGDTGVSRNQILIALLDQLLPLLADYEDSGFSPWRERWLELDAHAGKEVIVSSGDRRTAGTARGIDETGALVLDTALGRQVVHGGEVSVRAVE